MSNFVAVPLEVITAPNFWTILDDNRWEITDPNAQTLYFQLSIDDNLGLRRYVPAAGSTMIVIFQRADAFDTSTSVRINTLQSEFRTVTKAAVVDSNDRSLWSINLTTADVDGIVSGTVKFSLTESSVTTTWLQNFFLKKNITDAGF